MAVLLFPVKSTVSSSFRLRLPTSKVVSVDCRVLVVVLCTALLLLLQKCVVLDVPKFRGSRKGKLFLSFCTLTDNINIILTAVVVLIKKRRPFENKRGTKNYFRLRTSFVLFYLLREGHHYTVEINCKKNRNSRT